MSEILVRQFICHYNYEYFYIGIPFAISQGKFLFPFSFQQGGMIP
jgi:hypothetical protein